MTNISTINSNVSYRRNILHFLYIFLPLFTVSIIAIWNFYSVGVKSKYSLIQQEGHRFVANVSNNFYQTFDYIESDLWVLADHFSDHRYDFEQESSKENFSELYSFSKRKGIYDQIRFIDYKGFEKVRLDYNGGNVLIVGKDKMQNKRNRYYFEGAYVLEPGQVYMSRFDLNVENGRLEQLSGLRVLDSSVESFWRKNSFGRYVKPTIRFATPIFDNSGKKIGVIVLNYYGELLMKVFKGSSENEKRLSALIDAQGFMIKSFDGANEWAFVEELGEVRYKTFGDKYSREWQIISRDQLGQFHTENGLFTFDTVNMPADHYKFAIPGEDSSGQKYIWKVVSFVPQKVLNDETKELKEKTIFIALILFVVVFVGSYLVVQIDVKRKLFEEREKDLLADLAQEKKREAQELSFLNQQLIENEQRLKEANIELLSREQELKVANDELHESKLVLAENFEKLEKANMSMRGREMRIIEIKKRVKKLEEMLRNKML